MKYSQMLRLVGQWALGCLLYYFLHFELFHSYRNHIHIKLGTFIKTETDS